MATERALSRRVLILGLALFTLPIGAAIAGELAKVYHAPASDVMTLPRYCWAQYRLEFRTPRNSQSPGTCVAWERITCATACSR